MKPVLFVLLFAARFALAQTNFYPSLQCSNRCYVNATVESATPAAVSVFWDGGGERVAMTNLPEAVRAQYNYDPQAAEDYLAAQAEKKSARQSANAASLAAAAKAKAKLGKPQTVRVTKSISGGAEVEIIVSNKYEVVYMHNIPPEVVSFVDDFNNTVAACDAARYASESERVVISGPFRRSGDLTASAESVLATRRHMDDLNACVIPRTSILARPTSFVLPGGVRQWEFTGTPTPEESMIANHERVRRRLANSGL